MLFIPGQNPVIEQVSSSDGMLASMQLGKPNLGVGVDEGLLVNPVNQDRRVRFGAQVDIEKSFRHRTRSSARHSTSSQPGNCATYSLILTP